MGAHQDDERLLFHLQAAQQGDTIALGRLVRETQSVVWRFCRSLSSIDEADDLAQEVYIRASRSLGQFRGDAPVMSWLLSIARHVCVDQVRRNQRRSRLAQRLRHEHRHSNPTNDRVELDDLLVELDPDRRTAFVLTQMLGFSYEEVAEISECPIGTIRSRVARARHDLMVAIREAEAL